jgi:hypothetical protein
MENVNIFTMLRLFFQAPCVPGFAGAILRILFWPPSRARFDAIVNRED